MTESSYPKLGIHRTKDGLHVVYMLPLMHKLAVCKTKKAACAFVATFANVPSPGYSKPNFDPQLRPRLYVHLRLE